MVTLHVSVWVEINKFCIFLGMISVTLHVSVWVEIIFCQLETRIATGHAPRERVSWNVRITAVIAI